MGAASGSPCSPGHGTRDPGSWGQEGSGAAPWDSLPPLPRAGGERGLWHHPQASGAARIPCEAFGSETKEMWKLRKNK